MVAKVYTFSLLLRFRVTITVFNLLCLLMSLLLGVTDEKTVITLLLHPFIHIYFSFLTRRIHCVTPPLTPGQNRAQKPISATGFSQVYPRRTVATTHLVSQRACEMRESSSEPRQTPVHYLSPLNPIYY